MPCLARLTSVVLDSPVGSIPELPAEATDALAAEHFQGVFSGTLDRLTPTDYGPFRDWVSSVPYTFTDTVLVPSGRGVGSFYEPAVVLPCWPGVLAMTDPSESRDYDMALVIGPSFATGSVIHPDISVLRLVNHGDAANPQLGFQALAGIELLAVGELTGICDPYYCSGIGGGGSGLLPGPLLDSNPAWLAITRRLRKHAVLNRFKHMVVVDDMYAIYFSFSDPIDMNGRVQYAVTSTGGASGARAKAAGELTLREMFLLSVWEASREYGPVR